MFLKDKRFQRILNCYKNLLKIKYKCIKKKKKTKILHDNFILIFKHLKSFVLQKSVLDRDLMIKNYLNCSC